MSAVLFGSLGGLLVLAVPIGVALALAGTIAVMQLGLPLEVVPQRMFQPTNSFPFLAIPLFMLAGEIMTEGGVSVRLTRLATALIGSFSGGLAHVSTLSCVFMSGITGSGAADTAAVGAVMVPEMEKNGYPRPFSAAVIAASGALGPIIPPSIPMVVYGVVTGVSIGKLFLYGFAPGLFIGVTIMGLNWYYARKEGYRGTAAAGMARVWQAFKDALLALLMPLIIVGGIYGGVFTPTESAAVAVAYAFILSKFVYRELTWQGLLDCFRRAGVQSSIVMLVIAAAELFGWVVSFQRLPQAVAQAFLSVTTDPYVLLFLINVLLLIVGCFLNASAAITILAPILLPVVQGAGIDPLFFGLIMIINLSIGLITPPVGLDLFVISGIAKVPIERVARAAVPYIAVLVVDLMLITYAPLLAGFGFVGR